MRYLLFILMLLGLPAAAIAKPFKDVFPQIYADLSEEEKPPFDSMDLRDGRIFLNDNIATLDIPPGYYFLGPKDAQYVLGDLWGNPDDPTTLGMIFPEGISPFHSGSWAIEIHFDDIGYVSDEDAAGYDYDALLKDMQADTRDENAWRKENGYDPITLLGWAATPRYDAETRKLYWAKQLQFGNDETQTLNYNIRALGRKGVLILNFVAGMPELPAVEAALPDVLAMVNFTEGNRYSDFRPGVDTVAAVGIGGLIAGKVLAKTSLLAMGLILLKKFWIVLLLPFMAIKRFLAGRRSS